MRQDDYTISRSQVFQCDWNYRYSILQKKEKWKFGTSRTYPARCNKIWCSVVPFFLHDKKFKKWELKIDNRWFLNNSFVVYSHKKELLGERMYLWKSLVI
jgi:hypothetical protein